ncbi:MAG TPA: lytic transglycosylase domain-containing protein [Chloroflexota bacterium]|nr:lytic transglycosylase domain-containing protein [Chloroflexota bacterium]
MPAPAASPATLVSPSPQRAPAIAASPSPAARGSLGSPQTATPSDRTLVGTPAPSGQPARNATGTPTLLAHIDRNTSGPQPPGGQRDRNTTPTQTADSQPAADQGADDTIEAALDWQAYVPTDTADHLATMDRAARDSGCGVPWHLLAAIARVESDFGRNMAPSSAGALGYGQFLPSSWQSFGNDGNTYDYRDALPAIATYLCQSGLERDPRAALFAYNHADWYVDLVLDLAVRYDRMAPGAPTPDVLNTGPDPQPSTPMHYAAGRDVRLQSRARALDAQADWLGVPWHGRPPGAPISPTTLETSALTMVRAAFGLPPEPPAPTEAATDGLTEYANRAWDAGLLPAPIQPPVLLPAPDDTRPLEDAQWSIADIRASIERGQPIVALVAARRLPGHPANEAIGDQPLVLIGTTPTGLVYSDPSFSTSLGYGLELSDADFLVAWQAAASPRQALAFTRRPAPVARGAHLRTAEFPPVYARVLPTPAPPPPELTPLPPAVHMAPDAPMPGAAEATARADAVTAQQSAQQRAAATESSDDPSWMIILGAAAALLAALLFRRLRARRSA